jgi:hypothetical protein
MTLVRAFSARAFSDDDGAAGKKERKNLSNKLSTRISLKKEIFHLD